MSVNAGQMIQAGAIGLAIREYKREGGGAAGWAAAERALQERFPSAHGRSINAVIGHAQETVRIGNRYRQGGPNYTPPPEAIPDVRGLQRPPPPGPDGQPGPPRESSFHHEGIVEIRDPTIGNAVIQSFRIDVSADGILSRAELEARLREAAAGFTQTFIDYDPERLGRRQLQADIWIGGVYRGF